MPNKHTFDIKPIRKLIDEINPGGSSIDPFANKQKIATITNDLDPQFKTDYNLEALDFMKTVNTEVIDFVLFDPPYSPRQVSEVYKSFGKTVSMETTQSSYWAILKDEIQRVLKPGGKVISFGWNSNGVGKTRGFRIDRILIVAHGGNHNDTICTVETKLQSRLKRTKLSLCAEDETK